MTTYEEELFEIYDDEEALFTRTNGSPTRIPPMISYPRSAI